VEIITMTHALDARISKVALKQQGNIKLTELRSIGLTYRQVEYRVGIGRLYPIHRGVFGVGRPPKTGPEQACAAVLACGDQAALAGEAAAAAWGFRKWLHPPYDVIAPTQHKHPGINTHRSKLHPKDVRKHLGMRITSPARTLLDLAARLPDDQLKRAVNDARLAKRVTLDQLAQVIERYPRHPGAKRLKWFVEKGPKNPSRSGFEDEFAEFCEQYGLPKPLTNEWLAGYRTDAYFPDHGLVVELDGWNSHSDRASFEENRERDAAILDELMIPTIRITRERYETDPAREAARLHRILEWRRGQNDVAA
jgi:hypothetical protein